MEFPFMSAFRILLLLHLVGLVVGFGSAIVADTMFFRFLKDFKISRWEADVLNAVSKIVWTGILLLLITGSGLFLLDAPRYAASPRFLAKMTIVLILAINGTRLHFLYAPKLHKIAYEEKHPNASKYRKLRKGAFIGGAISVSSWFSALIIAWVKWQDVSYAIYIGAYALVLLTAIFSALLLDKIFQKQSEKS